VGEPGPVSERGCWAVVAATFKSEYSWHQCLHDFQEESLVRRGVDPKCTRVCGVQWVSLCPLL